MENQGNRWCNVNLAFSRLWHERVMFRKIDLKTKYNAAKYTKLETLAFVWQ